MPDEVVLDASVAAKVFIDEVGSDAARALVLSGPRLIAPEFIIAELASVAAKRVRRGYIPRAVGERMVLSAPTLFDELLSARSLVRRAFALASELGFSAYDSMYLALAERRACAFVTADLRLVSRAERAGLEIVIRTLE